VNASVVKPAPPFGDRLEQLSNQLKQKTCHHQAFLKDEGLERQLAPGVNYLLGGGGKQ
jgi:hypothetical protein